MSARTTALLALALALAGCAVHTGNPALDAALRQAQGQAAAAARQTGRQISENRGAILTAAGQDATFSMEQEFHLGKTVAANVLARFGPDAALAPDDPASLYVRRVGAVVAAAAAAEREEADRPYPFKGYRFLVVRAPAPNAVGMPGGFVVVTTGVLAAARAEDELAAVLAHEIAHVQRGHAVRPAEIARKQQNITSAVLAGTGAEVQRLLGTSIAGITDLGLDKGYSHVNEKEADRYALRYLAAAGYDPQALVDFLGRLSGVAASGGAVFTSRHPPAAQRVDALQAEAARLGRRDRLPRAARFERETAGWRAPGAG